MSRLALQIESILLERKDCIPDKYSDLDFTPPNGAQKAAKKAEKWKKKHGDEVDAGTKTGWTRANQLKKGKELCPNIVRRMSNFFSRHDGNQEISDEYEDEPWKDNGYVSWLIWGGDPGRKWADDLVDKMEKIDKEEGDD